MAFRPSALRWPPVTAPADSDSRSVRDDSRGAVLLEFLAVFMPLVLLFVGVWQVCELYAAKLVVSRACSAAGRAAAVVLPDNPGFYDQTPVDAFEGQRKSDIEFAVGQILAASPHFTKDFEVVLGPLPEQQFGSFQVTVNAKLACHGLRMLCPTADAMQLSATSVHAYHGAAYEMEPLVLRAGGFTAAAGPRSSGCGAAGAGGSAAGGTNSGGNGTRSLGGSSSSDDGAGGARSGAAGTGGRSGVGGSSAAGGRGGVGGSSAAGGRGGAGGSAGAGGTPGTGGTCARRPSSDVPTSLARAVLARAGFGAFCGCGRRPPTSGSGGSGSTQPLGSGGSGSTRPPSSTGGSRPQGSSDDGSTGPIADEFRETYLATGTTSPVETNRANERPYTKPDQIYELRPDRPGRPPRLNPFETYLWQVGADGTLYIAPERQPGFGVTTRTPDGRPVKHGDLNPGRGGMDRGLNRAGGELKYVDGHWVMNNDSSNSFAREDQYDATENNLRAALKLMELNGFNTKGWTLEYYARNVPGPRPITREEGCPDPTDDSFLF